MAPFLLLPRQAAAPPASGADFPTDPVAREFLIYQVLAIAALVGLVIILVFAIVKGVKCRALKKELRKMFSKLDAAEAEFLAMKAEKERLAMELQAVRQNYETCLEDMRGKRYKNLLSPKMGRMTGTMVPARPFVLDHVVEESVDMGLGVARGAGAEKQ